MVLDPAWSHRFQLKNGLTVLLKEQHGSPVVAFQAWVGVGSADEPEELAGIAHVFEHMLFKGTARRGVGQIAREVEGAGGDINAWTSFDQTVFHLVLASRFFDTGIDILADALRNSAFDPVELERELKVVLEEVKQGEDSPGRVVTQALFAAAYKKHNYRRPVIGYTRTVEAFKRKALVDFFRRYYVPNNITLVIVGDFDPAEARKKIDAAWTGARRRELPPSVRSSGKEPAQKKTRVVIGGAEMSEVHLVAAFHIPDLRHVDTAPLDVGSIILGQGDSSRLQRQIKRGRQVVSEAYAYSFTPRDPGLLVVGATLPPERTDEALAAMLEEAFRMTHEEVSPEELAKAQAIIESDAVYQKETVQGMARKLGFFETEAGSLAYEEEYLAQARAVTASSLRAAMARHLLPENCTLSVLLPSRSEALTGRAERKQLEEKLVGIIERAARRPKAPKAAKAAEKKASGSARAASSDVVREVLPSGTQVLVLRDPSVPLVAMRVSWLGGLRHETPETSGVSNLLSALVTRGTESRTGDEIAHEIESLAGALGGYAGKNSFGLRAEVMSRHFEHGLGVLADCILHPSFHQAEIDHEKRQVLEEIRTQEDNISSVAFRLFAQSLYAKHPYRLDQLGTPASLAALDRDRLVDYYRGHFSPAGMTIAIVGDVDPEGTVADVKRLFGGAEAHARIVLPAPEIDTPPSHPVRVHRFLNKQQAHLVIGFPGTTLGHPDRFALEVLSTILSGQGGRLFVELREKRGLAYRVSAFTLEGLDPGYIAVYVACSPENLVVAEASILTELRKLVDKPVPQAELARARRYLAGSHDISLQRRSALAATLAFNACYGLGWDQYRRYAESILAVTADDLRRVAGRYLDLTHSVTAWVTPDEASRAEPRAADAQELSEAARAPAGSEPDHG